MIALPGETMKQPVERRLAAILAADVAGYSRLMGADEESALAAFAIVCDRPKIQTVSNTL